MPPKEVHVSIVTKSYRIVFGVETPGQAIVAKRWLALAVKRDPRLLQLVSFYVAHLDRIGRRN
jgi:hypothetical protein